MLTDTFADFGFDSTDPLKNLQVMFIFLSLLLLYPMFSLTLSGCFFWSDRCKRCIVRMNQRFYWNTYIRFFLEAYLELSIATLIRFKKFEMGSGTAIFYSVASIAIASLLLTVFLLGVILP